MIMESASSPLAADPAPTTVIEDSAPTHQDFTEETTPEDVPSTTYLEGFESPAAGVVLMGTDDVGLRVHDYYLKAAR